MALNSLRRLYASTRQLAGSNQPRICQQSQRNMSGGHHSGEGVTYEGLTLYPPSKWHTYAGEGMAGFMWFWIFVRAYHDGSTLLFGHAQHFEHEHEEHKTDSHE